MTLTSGYGLVGFSFADRGGWDAVKKGGMGPRGLVWAVPLLLGLPVLAAFAVGDALEDAFFGSLQRDFLPPRRHKVHLPLCLPPTYPLYRLYIQASGFMHFPRLRGVFRLAKSARWAKGTRVNLLL